MPGYIKLCLDTWKVPFTVLNYDNVNQYTELPVDEVKRYSLPHIADIVRVHVLRDNGGYWLDADTIMYADRLPEGTIMGYPETRINTCGYLHAKPHEQMFEEWAAYQDEIISKPDTPRYWGTFANAFTDPYLKEHTDVPICSVENCWPEVYMIPGNAQRMQKYKEFYFDKKYDYGDIKTTDMLMLHNSWTPQWYKELTKEKALEYSCTLSNCLGAGA